MAYTFSKVSLSWVSPFRPNYLYPLLSIALSSQNRSFPRMHDVFNLSASLSAIPQDKSSPPTLSSQKGSNSRWKPMCVYYTQGKCTKMDDAFHLEKFNHDCSRDLEVNIAKLKCIPSQNFDFFLVLDLEGRVEILEFPVLMINAKTMEVRDFFHRFVRPAEMSEQRINEYIEGKYGKFGVDRVWHDTAIPFKEVLHQFEVWLAQHHLWQKQVGGCLSRAAFITCGNWDLKTKVPQQCKVSKMKVPSYFMEWINLKDVYLNFYKRRVCSDNFTTSRFNLKIIYSSFNM